MGKCTNSDNWSLGSCSADNAIIKPNFKWINIKENEIVVIGTMSFPALFLAEFYRCCSIQFIYNILCSPNSKGNNSILWP